MKNLIPLTLPCLGKNVGLNLRYPIEIRSKDRARRILLKMDRARHVLLSTRCRPYRLRNTFHTYSTNTLTLPHTLQLACYEFYPECMLNTGSVFNACYEFNTVSIQHCSTEFMSLNSIEINRLYSRRRTGSSTRYIRVTVITSACL